MKQLNPDFLIHSRTAFQSTAAPSLLELRQRIEQCGDLDPTRKRDMLSALNRIETLFGRPSADLSATPTTIRDLFANTSAKQLGVSGKTLANIRSTVIRALRDFGDLPQPLTKRILPSPPWQTLLDRVADSFRRHALYRLATFCTVMHIRPEDVATPTLLGLHEAMVAEEAVKNPRSIIKNTISAWNCCARTVEGWPNITLSSPFKTIPYTLPLTSFPESFQADVARYVERVLHPDLLDESGPAKPLRKSTVDHRVLQIRQFASALVHRGAMAQSDFASLADLFEPERFKEAIRFFLDRQDGNTTHRLHNQANALRHIARHHCRPDEATLSALETLCRKLNPGSRRRMSPRNRERLRQFDDPENIRRLLTFPALQCRLARKASKPVRAAYRMERAVAVALLIHCGLRIESLRQINIETDLSWSRPDRKGICHLTISGERVKNGETLEFELPEDVADLLRLHLTTFRMHLPGADSRWLFAGAGGEPRSKNALREGITRALLKDASLEMHPHLFRHATAKIVVSQDPGAYLAVSRVLGHRSLDTTTGYYLGTETKAAAQHFDRLLRSAKDNAQKKRRK